MGHFWMEIVESGFRGVKLGIHLPLALLYFNNHTNTDRVSFYLDKTFLVAVGVLGQQTV